MSYSKPTLIREIRTVLGDFPFVTACTTSPNTTITTFDVASTTKFDVGDILEFQDDGERVLVTALTDADTLTVIRNFDGSNGSAVGTGSAHTAGVLVAKNPRYPYLSIVDSISDVIYALWPYVYKAVTATITPVAGTKWYEIDENSTNSTEMMELSSVVQDVNSKPFWYGTRRTSYPVRLHFGVPTTIAGSGVAIEIPFLRSTTNTISVKGIGRITPTLSSTNYADLSAGVQIECVKFFTVAHMIEKLGILRVASDDITMTDESVRPITRETVAQYWHKRGVEARHRWEAELRLTLPRKQHKAGDFS